MQPVGRFSIRHLLLTTLVVGCWLALLQLIPHIAILLSGILLAVLATYCWLYVRKHGGGIFVRGCAIAFVMTTWSYLYVVSIGPAAAFTREHQDSEDMIAFYAPVGWLHANTPLREPLKRYADLWN